MLGNLLEELKNILCTQLECKNNHNFKLYPRERHGSHTYFMILYDFHYWCKDAITTTCLFTTVMQKMFQILFVPCGLNR